MKSLIAILLELLLWSSVETNNKWTTIKPVFQNKHYDQNWRTSFYVPSFKLYVCFITGKKKSPQMCYFLRKNNRSLIFLKLNFSAEICIVFCSALTSLHCQLSLKCLESVSKVLKPRPTPVSSLSFIQLASGTVSFVFSVWPDTYHLGSAASFLSLSIAYGGGLNHPNSAACKGKVFFKF